MSGWLWAAAAGSVILLGLVLYWLLVTTEGTFLGARVVSLLYNWTARRYDGIKGFDPPVEDLFLTNPLTRAMHDRPAPVVLDVATGTGRLPALLLDAPTFNGRVVGLDLARKMLALAAGKLADYPDRAGLVWQDAMFLPFHDGSFDLVSCLEALEFMPRPEQVLVEMVRVLRPGGLFYATRRLGWESRVMPGKCWSEDLYRERLASLGLERIQTAPWQVDYDLIWGWKVAAGSPVPSLGTGWWLTDLLRCPSCMGGHWQQESDRLVCLGCGANYPLAADGVVEMKR